MKPSLLAAALFAACTLSACNKPDAAAPVDRHRAAMADDADAPATTNDAAMSADTAANENPMVGGAPMYANKDIIDNAVNSKDHTTLVAAVKAAGLVDTLKGPGPFTVFAPTNAAFAALPAGTVDTLLKPEKKADADQGADLPRRARRDGRRRARSQIDAGGGKASSRPCRADR